MGSSHKYLVSRVLDMHCLLPKVERILFVGAHSDDIEIGCSGTILKNYTRNPKCQQAMAVFSLCETDSGLDFTADEILEDMRNAARVLGVRWKDVYTFNFPNTRLPERSYEIRNVLECIRDRYQPDVVYCNTVHDRHQDHVAIAKACIRAFRGGEELRCYEGYANLPEFKPNLYVDIDAQMQDKIEVLKCYKTQEKRRYWNEALWTAKAMVRGNQVGLNYAEAFELLRRIE